MLYIYVYPMKLTEIPTNLLEASGILFVFVKRDPCAIYMCIYTNIRMHIRNAVSRALGNNMLTGRSYITASVSYSRNSKDVAVFAYIGIL